MNEFDQLLRRFTDADRQMTREPFDAGEHYAASTGKVLLLIPKHRCEGEYQPGKIKVQDITSPVAPIEPIAINLAEAVSRVPQERRKEMMPSWGNCPSCEGSGSCDCAHCRASHDCGSCSGAGTRQIEPTLFPTFNGVPFTGKAINQIGTVQNVVKEPVSWTGSNEHRSVHRFEVGDLQLYVMSAVLLDDDAEVIEILGGLNEKQS